jgi:hypothetical protein
MRSWRLFLLPIVFLMLGAEASLACTCAPAKSAAQELEQATAVFAGKVIEIRKHKQAADVFATGEAVFMVEKAWKGVEERIVSVFTASHSAACGYGFKQGQTYLVCAHENAEERLSTSICSRTSRLEDARADVAELGAGKDMTRK